MKTVATLRSRQFKHAVTSVQPAKSPPKLISQRVSQHATPRVWKHQITADPNTNTYLSSPSNTRSLSRMTNHPLSSKSPYYPSTERGTVSKLNEIISQCQIPTTTSEHRFRRKSPKLSVSFQDLKDGLVELKTAESSSESINNALKRVKRRKKDERIGTDRATLRTFHSQRKADSNYVFMNFRRLPVRKHAEVLMPRKYDDTMNQYWSDLKS